MLGGVTRHMLPHLPGVPHLQVNRCLASKRFSLHLFIISFEQRTPLLTLTQNKREFLSIDLNKLPFLI